MSEMGSTQNAEYVSLTKAERETLLNALWDDGCHGFGSDHTHWPVAVESVIAARLREQEDRVRQTFALIGHLRVAQRELVELGVSRDDASRVLSALRREWIDSVAHELRNPPGSSTPKERP